MIGKTVEVNSRPREVIGIMPPGADVLDIRPEIWLPLGLNPSNRGNRAAHSLRVIGRLKDDVTPEAAQRELTTLNEHWGERVGVSSHMFAPNTGHVLQLAPLHDQIVSGARRADLDASGDRRARVADRLRQSSESPAGACGHTPA